jgi:hypothetical protein
LTPVLTVKIQLSKGDAYRAFLWHGRKGVQTVLIAALLITVIFARLLRSSLINPQPDPSTMLALSAGAFAACFALFLVAYAWNIDCRVRRFCSQPGFGEPTTLAFEEDGFHGENQYSSFHIRWPLAKGASETDRFVFLSQASGMIIVVPKRCLDDESLTKLREILRDRLNERARLR